MTRAILSVFLTLVLALSACGADEQAADEDPATESSTTEESGLGTEAAGTEPAGTETDDPAPAEGAGTVATADSEYGVILVDAEGLTLYVFDTDTEGESTCYDDCQANWPPLAADAEPEAGEGADAALLGTTERTDGSMQVTYDGRPLYYFAGDRTAGDTNGQAVGDVWWVVAPDGAAITNETSSSRY
ncbi:MAG: COG4315 family predicted lipoprotein [Egibacteraceae bacterium]